MTEILNTISKYYQAISFAQPDFWFSSRSGVAFLALTPYLVFLSLMLATALVFIFLQLSNKKNPFKRKFFQNRFWILLFFVAVASLLTFFRYQGINTLSARAIWLPYAFALIYFFYMSFIELSRKIPEKTSAREADLIKKRYLRPFKKRR